MTQVVSIVIVNNADADVGVHSGSQVCGAHNLLPRNV